MVVAGQIEKRQPKLAFVTLADGSTQQVGDEMVPIANAEDGNARREHARSNTRAGIVVDAVRAAGDDDSPRRRQPVERCFTGEHFGRNSEFPYFTSYEVAVLTAGIEYGYLRQLLSHPLNYDLLRVAQQRLGLRQRVDGLLHFGIGLDFV